MAGVTGMVAATMETAVAMDVATVAVLATAAALAVAWAVGANVVAVNVGLVAAAVAEAVLEPAAVAD